jgi:transcription elongation factor GreA
VTVDDEAITAEGLEELKAELAELQGPARHAMADRIKAARELGDLKENAEYHIAKEDQSHLETKIKRLDERLRKAVVVDVDPKDKTFSFGRTAHVRDEKSGKTVEWTLVGPTEANLADGKLSAESPVGQALIGRSAGDTVGVETPGGTRKYTIQKLA